MGKVVSITERLAKKQDRLADVKEHLLMEIEGTSIWRGRKAAEWPDDLRNGRSSESLTELEAYVSGLPADHALFKAADKAWSSREDLELLTMEVSNRLGRYGFDGKEDPENFIAEWIGIYEAWIRRCEEISREETD